MVVIDTSIAYKWFSQDKEELFPQALKLLKNHLDKKEIVTAPDLIIYELANSWATKSKLTVDQIKTFINDFSITRIILEPISIELIKKAIIFSKKHHVSVYDASYAVLAYEKKCKLYTADSKFISHVNLPYIKHLKDYKV